MEQAPQQITRSDTVQLSIALFRPLDEAREMITAGKMTGALTHHASRLRDSLDERNPGKLAVLIEGLSSHYPRMSRDDAAADQWARDWLDDTAHLPPFVVKQACDEWRRSDERWMPTPGQLLAKANRIMSMKLAELRRCETLLESEDA